MRRVVGAVPFASVFPRERRGIRERCRCAAAPPPGGGRMKRAPATVSNAACSAQAMSRWQGAAGRHRASQGKGWPSERGGERGGRTGAERRNGRSQRGSVRGDQLAIARTPAGGSGSTRQPRTGRVSAHAAPVCGDRPVIGLRLTVSEAEERVDIQVGGRLARDSGQACRALHGRARSHGEAGVVVRPRSHARIQLILACLTIITGCGQRHESDETRGRTRDQTRHLGRVLTE
jgi:hypothetical protein